MFIAGSSGCGKTSALQSYIRNKADNIIPIIISPKNNTVSRQGLSLFLNLDITNENEDMVLNHINHFMVMRERLLLLIFDGLNEVSDTVKIQQSHYCKMLELADKIYHNKYTGIKLIITCREQAYYEYKSATTLAINPLCFYANAAILKHEDASYIVSKLSGEDSQSLLDKYISADVLKQLHMSCRSAFWNIGTILSNEKSYSVFYCHCG